MVTFGKSRDWDLSGSAKVLLDISLDLSVKVRRLVIKHSSRSHPMGYTFPEAPETTRAHLTDPATSMAVVQAVYEPLRKECLAKAKRLQKDLWKYESLLNGGDLVLTPQLLDAFWNHYMDLESRFHAIIPDAYQQTVESPFKEPSAHSVTKL